MVMIFEKVMESPGGGTFLARGIESIMVATGRGSVEADGLHPSGTGSQLSPLFLKFPFASGLSHFSHSHKNETRAHCSFLLIHQLLPSPPVNQECSQLFKFGI